jgi:prepilin-type N-terminal cleavage/methylation domain-containing protein
VRTRKRPGDDHGFTLMELVVSMTIMSVVMTVVIAAIAQIYSATNRVDTASYDRSQLTIAFRRLDAEIRYATWLSTPGLVGTRYYEEYAVPNSGCRELKFDSGVLTLYSWVLPSATPANPVVLASSLTLTSGVVPFTTYAVGSTPFATASGTATADPLGIGKGYAPQFAQLRLRFSAATGPTVVPFDTVFTAENTNANTATSNDCSKGRPTS